MSKKLSRCQPRLYISAPLAALTSFHEPPIIHRFFAGAPLSIRRFR